MVRRIAVRLVRSIGAAALAWLALAGPSLGQDAGDRRRAGDPGVTAPQPQTPSDDGYNFAVLMDRITKGDIASIPDDVMTRSVVMTMWASFTGACGEGNMFLSLQALAYGGFSSGIGAWRHMARDTTQRSLPSVADGMRTGIPGLFLEPVEDTNRILALNGENCGNDRLVRFLRNFDGIIAQRSNRAPAPYDEIAFIELMSTRLRSKLGLADPAQLRAARDQRRREQERQRLVQASAVACTRHYANDAFCRCLVDGMTKVEFSDDDWRTISGNFEAVARVGHRHAALRGLVRACNK